MAQITIYRGHRVKDATGKRTPFYVTSKGEIYCDKDGSVRHLGDIEKDGTIRPRQRFRERYPDLLAEFFPLTGEHQQKGRKTAQQKPERESR